MPLTRKKVIDQLSARPTLVISALFYPAVVIIVCIVLGIPFLGRHAADWDGTYLLSARNLWSGRSIYHQGDGYIYPPFPALFALPFAFLPGILPKLTWYAVSFGCFIMMSRWSWRLAQGAQLARASWREHLAFILGVVPGATYAFNCFSHRQTDVLIGFCVIGGCIAFTRGRPFLAGAMYAIAAAMKGPALIFLPYLLWRRRPLAAAWILVVFFSLNLAPNMVNLKLPRLLLVEFAHDYLFAPKSARVYPDVWFTERNQSLLGSITRWTTTRWQWEGGTYRQRIPLARPASPATVKAITICGYGLLAVVLGTAVGWWPRRAEMSTDASRLGLEFAMLVTLMLVCSPMAAKAQWGVLMLPGFCLARLAVVRRNRMALALFAAGWCCWLVSQNWMSNNGVFVGLWYSAVLWNALLWFTGCAVACIRNRPASGSE